MIWRTAVLAVVLSVSSLTPTSPFAAETQDLNSSANQKKKRELKAELEASKRGQRNLLNRLEQILSTTVKDSIDNCKKAAASGNASLAKTQCLQAEQVMSGCESSELQQRVKASAEKLSAEYMPVFGNDGDFRHLVLDCRTTFLQFKESPDSILKSSNVRLQDASCRTHINRMAEGIRTGSLQNTMGSDDASLAAYLDFIKRMCSPDLVADAAKAFDSTPRNPEPVAAAALPRRRSAGTSIFQAAANEADECDRNRTACEARKRAKAAEAQSAQLEAEAEQKAKSDEVWRNVLLIATVVLETTAELERAKSGARNQNVFVPPLRTSVATPSDSSQIASCDQEIKNIHLDNDSLLVMNQRQKALFEGPCAGHPRASVYVNNAARTIALEQAGSRTIPATRTSMEKQPNIASSENSSGGQTTPVTAGGAPCISVAGQAHKNVVGTSGPFQRHEYKFVNACAKNVYLQITYRNGRGESSFFVPASSPRDWFCTDGFPANSDCGGGMASFTASYRSY